MLFCIINCYQATQTQIFRQLEYGNELSKDLQWKYKKDDKKRMPLSPIDYSHLMPHSIFVQRSGKIVDMDIKFLSFLVIFNDTLFQIIKSQKLMINSPTAAEELERLNNQKEILSQTLKNTINEINQFMSSLVAESKIYRHENKLEIVDYPVKPAKQIEVINNYYGALYKAHYKTRCEIELLRNLYLWVKARYATASWSFDPKDKNAALVLLDLIGDFVDELSGTIIIKGQQ